MNNLKNPNILFNSSKAICPPNCEFRQPKCQSYCRVYKMGKKERDELNLLIRKEKELERIKNIIPKRDRKRSG